MVLRPSYRFFIELIVKFSEFFLKQNSWLSQNGLSNRSIPSGFSTKKIFGCETRLRRDNFNFQFGIGMFM